LFWHSLILHAFNIWPGGILYFFFCRVALRQNGAHCISVKSLGLGTIVTESHPWILIIFVSYRWPKI
jgi:hypothetical protein